MFSTVLKSFLHDHFSAKSLWTVNCWSTLMLTSNVGLSRWFVCIWNVRRGVVFPGNSKPLRMCFSFHFQMLFNLHTELVLIAQDRTCGKNLANLFQRKRCISYKERKSEYHRLWKWRKAKRRGHLENKIQLILRYKWKI